MGMSTGGGDGRSRVGRSRSFPDYRCSWNIDATLSSGHQNSRVSLREIRPFPKEKEYEAKINDWKKRFNDLEMQLAVLKQDEAKIIDLMKQVNDLTLQLAARGEFGFPPASEQKVALRQILSDFKNGPCRDVNRDLMILARKMFPKEFSQEKCFHPTFTGMIKILVDRRNSEAILKDKLGCLLEVATAFRSEAVRWWDAEIGKQYFILCKSVAQWNIDTFHPKIKGMPRQIIKQHANQGMFRFDDVDLGPVVKELLHSV